VPILRGFLMLALDSHARAREVWKALELVRADSISARVKRVGAMMKMLRSFCFSTVRCKMLV